VKLTDPTQGMPRRELEESRLYTAFGLQWLELTVQRVAGVSKRTGEVRYRLHTTKYLVEVLEVAPVRHSLIVPPTLPRQVVVRLVTERVDAETGEAVAYSVTAWNCSCADGDFRGRERWCKHRTAVEEHGLLEAVAEREQGA
jgi:hypothetical protein